MVHNNTNDHRLSSGIIAMVAVLENQTTRHILVKETG